MASAFWQDELRDFEPTAFPDLTGASRSARKALNGIHVTQSELHLNLKTLVQACRDLDSTLLVLCQVAWTKVLAAYLGESDVCFGCAGGEATRQLSDQDDAEVIPLRVSLSPGISNKAVIEAISKSYGRARSHGEPSSELARSVCGPGVRSLYDTLLCVRSEEKPGPELGHIADIGYYTIVNEIIDSRRDNKLYINIHCQHSLIPQHDTHLIVSAFRQALLSILDSPMASILSWRPEYPQDQLSRSHTDVEALESPFGYLIHAAFEFYAESQPNALALDFVSETGERTQWTYATLDAHANRIANVLRTEHGLLVEDSVPICVAKSPAFYACVLGVLKAGGVFTPFSDAPKDRMNFMLDELGSKIVLHVEGEDMSWCLNTSCVNITKLLTDEQLAESSASYQTGRPDVTRSNLAYHMYTSGSTGRPKAVSVEHGNAVQTVCASRDLIPACAGDRMLQYAAPSFDMCYYDIFCAWSLGLCLCSAEDSVLFNDLSGVINRLNVSLMGLTPSVALALDPNKVPSVKWMYCIGETLPQSLVDAWEGKLVNSYGPTEATQMVTLFPADRKIKSAIIGKPFRNTSFTVLQKYSDAIAPVFALGELCIGGWQIARGYHANDLKTKEYFISRDGARMYRSGDNVRMLANGTFEFLGRSDDQVKIRGQRIELGEVDSALKNGNISISAVSTQILKPTTDSRDQLVAFLVTDAATSKVDQPAIQEAVLSYARSQLPAYMIPKLCIFIDRLPLSAAGKVDRRVLASLFHDTCRNKNAASPSTTVSQSSRVERDLRDIFVGLSGVCAHDIARNTSIFHLGLDSISAIQMSAQLKRAGYSVLPSDILSHPTITELAPLMSAKHTRHEKAEQFDFVGFQGHHRADVLLKCGVPENCVSSIRPCSPLQAGMIAKSLDSTMYFNHVVYRIPPDVDEDRLRTAWNVVVDVHEILRSGFVQLEDARYPVAMITYRARALKPPVDLLDHGSSDIHRWREETIAIALKNLYRPPWRVKLCKDRMHFLAHHSIYDAQVLDIIAADLNAAYEGTPLSDRPSFEPYLANVLEDFGASANPTRDFWTSLGQSITVTKFPVMTSIYPDTREFGKSTKVCSFFRDEVDARCRKAGLTLQAVGQAAWGLLLAAYVGQDAVTFGTVLSGRPTEDSDRICFPCITTVPTSVSSKVTRSACLKQLMNFNAEVQKHQFVPLRQITRWTGHLENALFDTLFTFQKRTTSQGSDNLIQILDNELTIDYPISVELELVGDNKISFRLYHRLDLVPAEQADLMTEQLDSLFTSLLDDIDSSGITVESANQHLYSINPPKVEAYSSDCTLLHHFVETSAQKTSQKRALEHVTLITDTDIERRIWSFEDLDNEGNRIANVIKSRGVAQGSIIAVCFDKCPEASFAMLGILKAGCGFLALDYGAPAARKKFIIQDSEAAMLLTKGLDSVHWTDVPAPVIDLGKEDFGEQPCTPPRLDRPINDQETAYCLYTSGTTGTPKGCIVTHENVVQAMLSFSRLYKWEGSSRWLAFASYHFDVSVMEQYWPWHTGICCVIAAKDLILEDLAGTIRKLNISHIDLTPSLAQLLDPSEVPSLANGVFVTGGEMLKREIIQRWGQTGAIYNAYGPTEATIGCTMCCGVPKNARPSNIGVAWPTAGAFVVNPDKFSEPVLRGAVGELCITGKLVSKGYLNRPELTKERFVHLAGQRAYRTGDLVRILYDGSFDFLGRADGQVKLRGQRLEVGEIDEVIKGSSNEVLDVSTQLIKHTQQQKQHLVSFMVSRQIHDKHKKPALVVRHIPRKLLRDIRSACAEHLPDYMVPSYIIPITSLPLSTNNKADGKLLQALYGDLSTGLLERLSEQADILVDTAIMSREDDDKIVKTLSHFLGVKKDAISRSISFFELGLDSISVVGFAGALRAAGFDSASSSMILRNASISRLVSRLSQDLNLGRQDEDGSIQAAEQMRSATQHRYKSYAASYLEVKPDQIEAIAPCTPLQMGMITRSLESTRSIYFNTFSFDLHEGVDISRLKMVWQEVLDRTQILRTAFLPTEDGHIQVVRRHINLSWREQDVHSTRLGKLLEEKRSEWYGSNDPAIITPFEIILSRTPDQVVMSLHIFHACYDGNSLPMLVHCLIAEYHGKKNVEYGPSYIDMLACGPLRESKAAKGFWIEHLRPLQHMVAQDIQPLVVKTAAEDFTITRHIEPLIDFESVRRKLNVTDQAIMQTCWAAVLQSITSASRVIGVVVSGRTIDFDGAEKVIGPLFNTMPFLMTFNEREPWQGAIKRCHDFNTSAIAFQHTSLRDIQKWTKQYRSHGAVLFDTLFVFQKEQPTTVDLEPIWTPRDDPYEADYPLSLEVVQTSEGALNVTLGVKAHMSNKDVSNSILKKFELVLRSLLTNTEQLVTQSVDVPTPDTSDYPKAEAADHVSNSHPMVFQNGTAGSEQTWTCEERKVRDIVAGLASVPSQALTQNTSILELGLDSIDAIKLSSKLVRSAGMRVSVSAIMQGLTITKIAKAVHAPDDMQKAMNKTGLDATLGLELSQYLIQSGQDTSDIQAVYPCTAFQEGIVIDMLRSKGELYFNHDVLLLSPDADINKLCGAFDQIIRATPILRTRFVEVSDPEISCALCQVIAEAPPTAWRERSVARGASIDSIFGDVTREAMKYLSVEPPFRLTLVKTSDTDRPSHIVLSMCHALYDGWSIGLLHEDVHHAYCNEDISRPSYERALLKLVEAPSSASEAFWLQSLSDIRTTLFPKRFYKNQQSLSACRQEIAGTVPLKEIEEFCRSSRITISALTQTVWACVLASYTRQLDVAFGQVLSGRDDEEANNLAFPFMNTVITRAVLHGSRLEMVQYVQVISGAIAHHQHFPLRRALALADSSGGDLFNTLFIYQNTPHDHDRAQQLYESVGGSSGVEYPVCVEAEVLANQLIWRAACKGESLDLEGTTELLGRLNMALGAVVRHFEEPTIEFRKGSASVCGLPEFQEVQQGRLKDPRGSEKISGTTGTTETEWSQLEQVIRQVVAKVARVDQQHVQKQSSTLAIGIDSISAIKMSSMLRKLSIQLNVGEIIQARTVAEMARTVDYRRTSGTTAEPTDTHPRMGDHDPRIVAALSQYLDVDGFLHESGITPETVAEVKPATAGQVFMLSRWQNHGLFYPRLYFDISGCGDLSRLQDVWTKIILTTSIFRTLFVATGDIELPVIQVVLKDAPSDVVEVQSSTTLDAAIASYINGQNSKTIRPPVTLYAQRRDGKTMVVAIHLSHALYDGFVLPTLIEHLRRSLQDSSIAKPAENLTFSSYIGRIFALSPSRKQFWLSYLADMQPVAIQHKSDTTNAKVKHNIHVVRPHIVPSSTMKDITNMLRTHHVTVQSLFLAAYARIHARLATSGVDIRPSASRNQMDGPEDILVGIYTANRTLEGADELMAPTIGFVPIRIRSPLSRSVTEIAKDIQHDLRAIGEDGRGCVGLWELDAWLKEERESGIKVDVWINLLRSWEENGNGLTEMSEVGGSADEDTKERITIRGSEHGAREVHRDDVNEVWVRDEDVTNGLLLKDNAVRGVYGSAMDLEATVHKESLSIGVVAPEEMLDLEGARTLIEDLANELDTMRSTEDFVAIP